MIRLSTNWLSERQTDFLDATNDSKIFRLIARTNNPAARLNSTYAITDNISVSN